MAAQLPPESAPKRSDVPSPIEATLRIVQSSVTQLIGGAVVRHGDGTVAAQFGRVPWLFDRRLTQIELSDDALPANHAVLLDWPVPHQAQWVGAPPRLLIARLVAAEKTVGVVLGTLITREQLEAKTREAIELSCQLIASAIATENLARESEQQARRLQVLNELQRALSNSLDARELGRILRDAVGFVLEHIGFAVSLFHPQRAEVAYRYRVVDANALSHESARRPLDDGPSCRAAQRGERVVFTREIELPLDGGRTMRRSVHVVQFPLVVAHSTVGVVTVQAFRPDGFSAEELALAQSVVETSANYFAHARRVGVRRPGPDEPKFTLVAGTGPVPPSTNEAAAEPAAASEAAAPAPTPAAPGPDPDRLLAELLRDLGALGSPHAFAVVADEEGGSLRGHSVSDWTFMKQLDRAVGITARTFTVSVDDRANAIARACREGRVVNVAWLFEAVQPALTWQESLDLERAAGGGRCTIVPLIVAERIAGAIVAGPSGQDLSGSTIAQIVARIEATAEELTRLVLGQTALSDDELRLAALRETSRSA
ncbi:MAG TPA: GAF domain-containing protein [Candidatus Dormibacteraeota bacterium]|nr:GAF domain-containing protein [Candidatus Dormibacteraeota bacterium]